MLLLLLQRLLLLLLMRVLKLLLELLLVLGQDKIYRGWTRCGAVPAFAACGHRMRNREGWRR